MTDISEITLEAAARAVQRNSVHGSTPWENLTAGQRIQFRRMADAAIQTYLAVESAAPSPSDDAGDTMPMINRGSSGRYD